MNIKQIEENYEQRKIMWLFLSKLFNEVNPVDFIWMYSKQDLCIVNRDIGGIAGCCKDAV